MFEETQFTKIYNILKEYFEVRDLHDLCFMLGIDDENLDRNDKFSFARSIIVYCKNRGLLPNLIEQIAKARPNLRNELELLKKEFEDESIPSEDKISRFFNRFFSKTIFISVIIFASVTLALYMLSNPLNKRYEIIPTAPVINTPQPLEPNDTIDVAIPIDIGIVNVATINDLDDWYELMLENDAKVVVRASSYSGEGQLVIYNEEREVLGNVNAETSESTLNLITECVSPGIYYLRVYSLGPYGSDANRTEYDEYRIEYSVEFCNLS